MGMYEQKENDWKQLKQKIDNSLENAVAKIDLYVSGLGNRSGDGLVQEDYQNWQNAVNSLEDYVRVMPVADESALDIVQDKIITLGVPILKGNLQDSLIFGNEGDRDQLRQASSSIEARHGIIVDSLRKQYNESYSVLIDAMAEFSRLYNDAVSNQQETYAEWTRIRDSVCVIKATLNILPEESNGLNKILSDFGAAILEMDNKTSHVQKIMDYKTRIDEFFESAKERKKTLELGLCPGCGAENSIAGGLCVHCHFEA